MTTTADEKLQRAEEDVQSAIENVSEVLVNRCWGYDEYNESYLQRVNTAFNKLREVRDLLDRRR